MTASVKHLKVSAIPDAGDPTLVEPSDWNAAHVITGLTIGTDIEAWSANLDAWSALATSAKQNAITLTTTGSSGAATLVGATLNVPNYTFTDTGITQLTGDVTAGPGSGSQAATVVKINGTALSGLGTGILKNTTGTGVPSIAIAADFPTLNQNTTGSAAKWTTPRNLAGNSVDGSAAVAFANAFIVQGTADSGLTGAQFMGALGTGLVKNTTTTGVQSIAAAGTDYIAPGTIPVYTATRTTMAALTGASNLVVWLEEAGRQGWFQWNSANLSTQVTADAQQGVYVPPSSGTTGASGAWVRQYSGALSGAWFGAKIDGSTNDTTAWNAALSLASFLSGVTVLHPGGVSMTDELTLPANCSFVGLGAGSVLRARSASRSLINVTGSLTRISGLDFDGNSTGLRAIRVAKTADNKKVWIDHNYIASFVTYGLEWTLGDCASISENIFVNAAVTGGAIVFSEDGRNSDIEGNYILGTSGIHILRTTQGMEGSRIRHNVILPTSGAGAGSYCYTIEAGLEILIEGNIFDQVVTGVAGQIVDTHPIANIKSVGNWYGAVPSSPGATYGLYIQGGANGFESLGDTFVAWAAAGIYLNGLIGAHNISSVVRDTKFYFASLNLRDIQLDYTDNVLIDGCIFNSAAPIVIGASAIATGIVSNNDFRNGTPSAISSGLRYLAQRSTGNYADEQVTVLSADNTAPTNVNTAQNVFPTGQGTLTVAALTAYEFEALYEIDTTGTTSNSLQTLFGGTATFTSIAYMSTATNGTASTTASAALSRYATVATAINVTAAVAAVTQRQVHLRGTMRINAAGTVIPQFQYSAAPGAAPVVRANSFFRCWPIGTNTVTQVGNWS